MSASFSVLAQACAPGRIDEFARVARVVDGDTVQLEDKRHVRLIGINAAETGKDGQPSEPYADEARKALWSLLKPHSTVGLRFDAERHDRHHRLLAHLYIADSQSVQAWMLENGYAVVIAVPPNLWNLECYQQAEQRAQRGQIGLWSRSPYYIIDPLVSGKDMQGFYIVKGRVNEVGETEKSLRLILEGGMVLRIDREDLPYFAGAGIRELNKQEIIARGWVRRDDDRPVMRLRHPASLQVLE